LTRSIASRTMVKLKIITSCKSVRIMAIKKSDGKKRISVEVGKEFHKKIKIKAAQDEVNIADLVRALLGSWVSGEVKVEQQ